MSTSWVASSVRARAISRRRLGAAAARALASRPSLESAVDALGGTPYGHHVHPGQSLAQAQQAVAGTALWHLRVLAGWVPRGDARILRVLAGGFEIANVDERLRELTLPEATTTEPVFRLGTLACAWTALARATTVADLRDVLARSAWGDPGSDTAAAIRLGMRLSWAVRVAASVPAARPWAAGAAAIILARERQLEGRRIPADVGRLATSLLGARWSGTGTLRALAASLSTEARWALDGIDDPAELWRAEARWWGRVDSDGRQLLRSPVTSDIPVIGAAAVLAVDAWRVRAALEVAARGGAETPGVLEAFDVVA